MEQLSLDELMQSSTEDVVPLHGEERIPPPDPSKKMPQIEGLSHSKLYSPKEIVEMGKNRVQKTLKNGKLKFGHYNVQRDRQVIGSIGSKPVSYIAIPEISSKIQKTLLTILCIGSVYFHLALLGILWILIRVFTELQRLPSHRL